MAELYHGPVPEYSFTPELESQIAEMLESDDELTRLYGEIYQNNCFVTELGQTPNGGYMAAVGSIHALDEIAFRTGKEVNPAHLGIADLMAVGALPGNGEETRVQAVQDAFDTYLRFQSET